MFTAIRVFLFPTTDRQLPAMTVKLPPRLLLIAAPCLWSLGGTFIKAIDVDPVSMTFYRSLFVALFLAPFLSGKLVSPHPLTALSIPAYAVTTACFIIATKITTAANASLLLYTAPIYVFLLGALFLKETPDRKSLVALASSVLGMVVIFYGGAVDQDLKGVLIGMLSGVGFAVYMISIRRLRTFHPFYLAALHNGGLALLLGLLWPLDWGITGYQFLAIAGMAAVQLALPSVLFITALRDVPAHEASLITLIEPVLNILLVAYFIGEIPSIATMAGGALIIGGLLFRYMPTRKPRMSPVLS